MANFFVDKADINGGFATVRGEEAEHICRVLRMKAGDSLTLCDGEGNFCDGVISAVDGKEVRVKIEREYAAPTEPKLKITLFQGIPKNPKLEFIVQKAVEIGAAKIVPVNTARIVAKLDKECKLERLRKIAREAAKQSRRGIVPAVEKPLSFDEAVLKAAEADIAIIPYEEEATLSLKEFLRGKKAGSLSIIIGPEGGFEKEEIETARKEGIAPVTLGKRILRTETAGLVTAAMALYEMEQ